MLIICYVLIVLVGIVFVVFRNETVLLRGERFFGLTVFFLLGASVSTLVSRIQPSGPNLIFWVAALLAALLLKPNWVLLREDGLTTARVLENSLSMLLIGHEQNDRGYSLQLGDDAAFLDVFRLAPKCCILRFRGEAHQKKIRLLRSLLIKKFQPVFPRLTIDLR